MPKRFRERTRVIHDPATMQPGEGVTIRCWFGDADKQAVLSSSTEFRQNAAGETIVMPTLERLAIARRGRAVVSWTLLDEEGDPLPLTQDVLANLPSAVASFIDDQIRVDWDNLGEPQAAQSPEEVAQHKQDGATFRGRADGDAAGEARDNGAHERKGPADRPLRRPAAQA